MNKDRKDTRQATMTAVHNTNQDNSPSPKFEVERSPKELTYAQLDMEPKPDPRDVDRSPCRRLLKDTAQERAAQNCSNNCESHKRKDSGERKLLVQGNTHTPQDPNGKCNDCWQLSVFLVRLCS